VRLVPTVRMRRGRRKHYYVDARCAQRLRSDGDTLPEGRVARGVKRQTMAIFGGSDTETHTTEAADESAT